MARIAGTMREAASALVDVQAHTASASIWKPARTEAEALGDLNYPEIPDS